MTTINYTNEINSFTGCFETINATEYEAVCKIKKECYECIPDDVPVKLYFDIDVSGLASEYDNDLVAAPFIRDIAKETLTEFCNEFCKTQPEFHISSSHTENVEIIDKKGNSIEKWKISFHLNINNIIALKSDQKKLNKKLNELARNQRPDLIDYLGVDDKNKPNDLFDVSVYDPNRKMRSVHCSKRGQNRYLKIEEGNFEGSVISAFIPVNATLHKEPISKETIQTKVVTKITDGINNYNRIYFQNFLEKGALHQYSKKYDKWRDIGFILFNEFGRDEGWNLFDEFSKLCREKYDIHYNREWWDKLQDNPDKPVLFGTLIKWVKEDENDIYLEVKKIIYDIKKKEKNTKVDDDILTATDNNSAALLLIPKLKDILIPCKGQWFLKNGNIWINDKDYIDNYILDFIMTSEIYKKNKDNIVPYVQDVGVASKIQKSVYAKLITQTGLVNIYDKFHSTTKNRLCFLDGVIDFKMKRFYLWSEVNFEYYSTVQIKRNYADYFKTPDKKVIADVKSKIIDSLFGNDVEKALQFLSRAITGNIMDKNYGVFLGARNNGKGAFYDLNVSGFEDYVGSFVLDNVLYQRSSKNTSNTNGSRDLYWLIDFEFKRLAISQEVPTPDKNMSVNGGLWKKMCGGGDEQTARRCYDRKDLKFIIDTTFLSMGNDELMFDCIDVKEHQVDFCSVKQFKTKEEIEEMKLSDVPESVYGIYGIKDPAIKESCKSSAWGNAYVYLLYENYIDNAVLVPFQKDSDDDIIKPLRLRIADMYEFTNKPDDIVLVSDVNNTFWKDNRKLTNNNITSMGAIKKRHYKEGIYYKQWCYYGMKEKDETTGKVEINSVGISDSETTIEEDY